GLLEGFQLWINLPGSHKMSAPAYQEHDASNIPVESRDGAEIRVVAGETSGGTRGPVLQPLTDPLYLDVSLQAQAAFSEPVAAGHSAFVYVIGGEVGLAAENDGETVVGRDQLAVLGPGDALDLHAGDEPARFLLIAGKPLGEPVVRGGPFVMNTREELMQAFSDYQSGNF
ncbi:MAG: pirin-like C-terminal cupin domain-containing protein, partial [Gammaproteobacteria bacterium]